MLNDVVGISAVYIMTGYTDLRSGIDRLAALVESKTDVNPCQPNTLYLFCGRRTDRIKGLLWEGDGFLLVYKRIDNGALNWPRSSDDALEITEEQYRMLMQGLEVVAKRPIREVSNPPNSM